MVICTPYSIELRHDAFNMRQITRAYGKSLMLFKC